ncbi:MAG: hypothetical protein LBC99_07295 [Spirochaetota bacterium]|jgi:tetratricopeptide (TPR) repeat protein|nr:hypothetical protein [Spirochaetota bacterium]
MALLLVGVVCLFAGILAVIWNMGFSMRLQKIEALVRGGAPDAALPLLRNLEKKHHGKLALHLLLARVHALLAQHRDAIEEWNRVLLINQHHCEISQADIALALVENHLALGELREAQGVLLLTLKSCPGELRLRERLAEIYLQRGMPKHALECYDILLKYDPENNDLLYKIALVQERSGDLRAALISTLRILRQDAQNASALAMAANLYSGFANHRSAEEYWRKLIGYASHAAEGYKGLAACLDAQGGRDDETLAAYSEALQYARGEQDRLAIQYAMVSILIRMEALRDALALLEDIQARDPGYRDVAYLIDQYRELARDELVARFTSADDREFRRLAGDVLITLGVSILREKPINSRDLLIHGILDEGNYRETVLTYFARTLSPITERTLQELSDEMRVMRAKRAYMFSMAGYSVRAKNFAALRAITLIARDELKTMLDDTPARDFLPAFAS